MKKHLILSICICCSSLNIACSSNAQNTSETKHDIKESSISIEDKAIIKKYKDRINSLDFSDRELVNKTKKDSLPEIRKIKIKIKNEDEREKIEMNIYLSTGMYNEAYTLNTKILKSSPYSANLITQCELIHNLKLSKTEFERCHAKLALAIKKDLEKTSKNDPEYIYGEWGYFLSMYKSGHKEYDSQLKKILDSTKDEQIKFQLESSYELAVEQKNSYENN